MATREDLLKFNFFEFTGCKTENERAISVKDYTNQELYGFKFGTIHSRKMRTSSMQDSILFFIYFFLVLFCYYHRKQQNKKMNYYWGNYRAKNL